MKMMTMMMMMNTTTSPNEIDITSSGIFWVSVVTLSLCLSMVFVTVVLCVLFYPSRPGQTCCDAMSEWFRVREHMRLKRLKQAEEKERLELEELEEYFKEEEKHASSVALPPPTTPAKIVE